MLFLGHLATGVAIADATDSDHTAAVVGTMLPDVIDKTGSWVFHVFPKGRYIAHGLPFFAAVSAIAVATQERRKARGFVLGYLGHLICDLWGGGKVPWFAPFEKTRRTRGRTPILGPTLKALPPEIVGAWFLVRRLNRWVGEKPAPSRETVPVGEE
jgi:membrane-bound metal-dependent hydrolase YbcI (DUF457 family)